MDTMYQRSKIQEESLYYEQKKHDGSLPIVGVNMFLPRERPAETTAAVELIRSTDAEKTQQITNVERFRRQRNPLLLSRGGEATPAGSLAHLRHTAAQRMNVFASLMEAVKFSSLGQISHALYGVGGEYRRNM